MDERFESMTGSRKIWLLLKRGVVHDVTAGKSVKTLMHQIDS